MLTAIVGWTSGREIAVAAIAGTLAAIAYTVRLAFGAASEQPRPSDLSQPELTQLQTVSWTDLVDAMIEPILILDSNARISYHNKPARMLFNKQLRGLPLEYVSREPELIRAVDHCLTSGDATDARMTLRLDVERHLHAIVMPLKTRDGKSQRSALLTIRDVSEQQKLLLMRSDFIANASHELRTPLASVRGFIETLQGSARDDAVARHRFLGIMASQAERMTRLIDDLLLLSRVEEKAYLAPTASLDINVIVRHVVQTLMPLAIEKDITVALEPAPSPARVTGDADELVQVFQNLIENAIKYGSVGGNVLIKIELHGAAVGQRRRVTIQVTDDGPGIAPLHLPRLTERFYRVNADQSRSTGGTGLGLAIVKHVVTRHQGELDVASVVGQGSVFTVTLDERP